jgi:hypothetical protein
VGYACASVCPDTGSANAPHRQLALRIEEVLALAVSVGATRDSAMPETVPAADLRNWRLSMRASLRAMGERG